MIRRAAVLCTMVALGPAAMADQTRNERPVAAAPVEAVVRAHLSEIEGCYRRNRKLLGAAVGRIDLQWEFRDRGRVVTASAVLDTLGAPELRQCIESAVMRWTFSPVRKGWISVTMPFVFGPRGVSFGKPAESASTLPDVQAGTLRSLLLRFGPELVSFACVAGPRSFLGRACDAPISRNPRLGLDPRYKTDGAVACVHPALVRFEHEEVDARGFSIDGWPHPPADGRHDSGPLDGFAVWPPDAFQVHLAPYGEGFIHDGVRWSCSDRPWSPCRDDDRPADGGVVLPWARVQSSPLAEGPLLHDAERLLAPVLKRFTEHRRIHLLETVSVDLDGDGQEEKLVNLAVTDVEPRPGKNGEQIDFEIPTELFFILLERAGRLVRLPVDTVPSRFEGMDGAIFGWLDLDGDGGRELIIETPGYEIGSWQVVRFRDGALHPVAEFGFSYMGQIPPSDGTPESQ